jgi:ABC-type sugar transport system permease subunit
MIASRRALSARRADFRTAQRRGEILWGFLFVAPMLILLVTFTIYPIFESARITMYNWSGIGNPTQYVGLRHFVTVATDEWFWNAFKNTVIYAAVLVPIQLTLTLILAVILSNPRMPWRTLYRTVYFIPVVTSIAIVAVVVRLMLNASGSVISQILNVYPPTSPIVHPDLALPSVILFGTWHSFGINLIYWLAALQTVPEELYDAAKVDGANGWQRILYVTLPAIRPFAAIILFLAILGSLKVFEQSFVLTRGGPYFASEVVSGYIYTYAFGGDGVGRAFSSANLGYASAASFFMSILVLGITLIQVTVLRVVRKG